MIVNVRTHDDLTDLLRNRASGNWKIGQTTEHSITKVRVFNWDTNQVLKGDFDRARSLRDVNGDLIISISKCRIENFRANERWFDIFQMAAVVYTPFVTIQNLNGGKVGVIRDANFDGLNQNEINDFFKRLISEIRLQGLNNIVFRAGSIPIPDFFREWCLQNGVTIEILYDEDLDRLYPKVNDDIWEDDLFDRDQNIIERD